MLHLDHTTSWINILLCSIGQFLFMCCLLLMIHDFSYASAYIRHRQFLHLPHVCFILESFKLCVHLVRLGYIWHIYITILLLRVINTYPSDASHVYIITLAYGLMNYEWIEKYGVSCGVVKEECERNIIAKWLFKSLMSQLFMSSSQVKSLYFCDLSASPSPSRRLKFC